MPDLRPTDLLDDGDALPAWMTEALRRPVHADPAHAARIAAAARALPRPRRSSASRRAMRPPRWATRRGMLAPGGGALVAAMLTLFVSLGRVGLPGGAAGPAAGTASAIVLR